MIRAYWLELPYPHRNRCSRHTNVDMTPNKNSQHFRRIESIGNCPRLLSTFTQKVPITKHWVWRKSVAPTRHMLSQQKKRSISLVNSSCRSWFSESNPLNRPYLWPYTSTVTGKCKSTTPNVLSRCLINVLPSHDVHITRTSSHPTQDGSNSWYPDVSKFLSCWVNLIQAHHSANKTNWIRIKNWQRALYFCTWFRLNGSIGICSNIPVPSINSNNINVSGRKLNTRRQFFCPQLFWPTAILVDSFFFFSRDTCEVKTSLLLRPLDYSQLQPYATTYLLIQFWNQILISSQIFSSIFSVQSMVFNGSLVRNLPRSLCVVFRPLDYFFLSSGLNRGI